MLKWLRANRKEGCTANSMKWAAKRLVCICIIVYSSVIFLCLSIIVYSSCPSVNVVRKEKRNGGNEATPTLPTFSLVRAGNVWTAWVGTTTRRKSTRGEITEVFSR